MKKKIASWLTQVQKVLKDPYSPKAYLRYMLLVPKPTRETPYPCILVSIRNGHTKLFFRVRDLKGYYEAVTLSAEAEARIEAALKAAEEEVDMLEEENRLIWHKRRLPDARLVDTTTGEVIHD